MVSKALLDRFKKIYEEEYNIVLSDEDALKMATDLLNVMRIVTRPLPKSELEETFYKVPGEGVKINETD